MEGFSYSFIHFHRKFDVDFMLTSVRQVKENSIYEKKIRCVPSGSSRRATEICAFLGILRSAEW
jgi:hypothetical protein